MPLSDCLIGHAAAAVSTPVHLVEPLTLNGVLERLPAGAAAYARALHYEAKAGAALVLPSASGGIEAVLFGLGARDANERTPMLPGRLAAALPPGDYHIAGGADDDALAALAFALHAYRFTRYRAAAAKPGPRLAIPAGVDAARLAATVDAIAFGRDLINTPANDLGPEELADAALGLAECHGGRADVISGEALRQGFPLVHAVGAGSARGPRIVDLSWGESGPKITLVGKGVVFDSGGLDIKPSAGMLLMKKDMGGAASVLALASLLMAERVPLRLRVLVPIVENAISGTAFRPGDVFRARNGIAVEIGNTDAEGRLILADALSYAGEANPDLMIDMATLTGAARVALGPDLPPFYTRDDTLAGQLAAESAAHYDPLWRMPLWRPYFGMIEAKTGELNNSGSSGFAGSLTAALFLSRFVAEQTPWLHLDVYGWSPSASAGRPEGGEIQGVRALYAMIRKRFDV